jgi:hypothetical protein
MQWLVQRMAISKNCKVFSTLAQMNSALAAMF